MSFNRKDAVLNRLAERFNVAQFVSFEPHSGSSLQKFCRILGEPPNYNYSSTEEAIKKLFEKSNSHSVNIRTYTSTITQNMPFVYGLRSVPEVLSQLERFSSQGAFTIVNETIDVSDGGVSGVAMGGVVEFRPDATPRGVEKPGFASLPNTWAEEALRIVYGFDPQLEAGVGGRLEFSIHPKRLGWLHHHTVYWEYEDQQTETGQAEIAWPNDFSRLLGDKVYGLLIAHIVGEAVPVSTVINRRLAPFTFGSSTTSSEHWLRTAPYEQEPGRFSTTFGWQDPFRLLHAEDAGGNSIASVISQAAVDARWSGAALTTSDARLWIEGVSGSGDAFMIGERSPENIPEQVQRSVEQTYLRLVQALGPVRFEWAYDGNRTWVLQLHKGASTSSENYIVPGDVERWIKFETELGLGALRELIRSLPQRTGVALVGSVGLTSHIADLLRKSNIPSKFI